MREVVVVLRVLRESKSAIDAGNIHELKKLSVQAVRSAAVSQDPDNVIVAVLVYALGKVFERSHYRDLDGWSQFEVSVSKNLSSAIRHLESGGLERARAHLGRIRNSLNKISGGLGGYVKDIFRKAEINKAFKLYEHGLSSEQTAKLLGVSLWDLASYIGQSSVHDSSIPVSVPVEKRVRLAEGFFS